MSETALRRFAGAQRGSIRNTAILCAFGLGGGVFDGVMLGLSWAIVGCIAAACSALGFCLGEWIARKLIGMLLDERIELRNEIARQRQQLEAAGIVADETGGLSK